MSGGAAVSPLNGDRERRDLVVQQERRELEQWIVQPWWALILAKLGVVGVYLAVVVAETPLMASALEVFMAGVPEWQILPMAVCVLVGYAVVWHTVGERLMRGEFVGLRSDRMGGRFSGNPGFGAIGWMYVVAGLATAGAVAYLRADSAATLLGEDEERRQQFSVAAGDSGADPAAAAQGVYAEKLVTEILANAALMGLMALVAIALARRWHALSVATRLRRTAIAAQRLVEQADARESAAEADLLHAERLRQGIGAQRVAGESIRKMVGAAHDRALWAAGMEVALEQGTSTPMVTGPIDKTGRADTGGTS